MQRVLGSPRHKHCKSLEEMYGVKGLRLDFQPFEGVRFSGPPPSLSGPPPPPSGAKRLEIEPRRVCEVVFFLKNFDFGKRIMLFRRFLSEMKLSKVDTWKV